MSVLMRRFGGVVIAAGCVAIAAAKAQTPGSTPSTNAGARRPLRAEDLYRLEAVRDPERSPDGQWVAYTVTKPDSARDKRHTQIWMTSWDGSNTIQLTTDTSNESRPRWSPDGRYISFLSARGNANETSQLWLMSRQGGEGIRITNFTGDVNDYAWSPDGTHIVLVVEDDPDAAADDSAHKDSSAQTAHGDHKKPKPIVIDRYEFKEDITGYLGKSRDHLYLLDVGTHASRILTPDAFDEQQPAWSPDGRRIAFVSKRSPADVDRANNWDVFAMDTQPGAAAVQLTTWPGPDNPPEAGRLAWSPDGSSIAYVRGTADPRLFAYDELQLAVVSASGGEPRVLTAALDRAVSQPQWSADGHSITVLVEDDRSVYPARVDVESGSVTRTLPGALVISGMSLGHDGALTALIATDSTPPEVCVIDHGEVRRLTHRNDAWLTGIQLGTTEDFASRSKDGTDVHGVLVKPAGAASGHRYPTLLRIHGGPNGQDAHDFSFERQLFAANGYVVVSPNYRGSAGRGAAYQKTILADWGHKEVADLLGAMDHVVAAGIADPDKLGIGGWSYGGILTDYSIATDPRFKAATSGAGSALQLSMYGVDEYIQQYVAELGQPWEHPELWIKLSYPFFHVTRISTPTLFLGGDKDFNVPVIGGEQMYQALRVLNVPTELVIYPDQFHGLTRPSFEVDRLRRYLDWYAKYIPGGPATARK
jgi:dipeptidyl aminopeptidase/acylaminoacyl peptidase